MAFEEKAVRTVIEVLHDGERGLLFCVEHMLASQPVHEVRRPIRIRAHVGGADVGCGHLVVEAEEDLVGVVDLEDVGAHGVEADAEVDIDRHHVARLHVLSLGVTGEDLLDRVHSHGDAPRSARE